MTQHIHLFEGQQNRIITSTIPKNVDQLSGSTKDLFTDDWTPSALVSRRANRAASHQLAVGPNYTSDDMLTIETLKSLNPEIKDKCTDEFFNQECKKIAAKRAGRNVASGLFIYTDSNIASSPAVGSDGTVYVGSRDKHLYAINTNGTQKWKFLTGGAVDSSLALGPDGSVNTSEVTTIICTPSTQTAHRSGSS